MKLKDLLIDALLEIGDLKGVEPYPMRNISPYGADFKLDNDVHVHIVTNPIIEKSKLKFDFGEVENYLQDIYNVGFDVGGSQTQFKKTNYLTLLRIIRSVVEVIQYQIKKYASINYKGDPLPIYVFFAGGKSDLEAESPQKKKLYQQVILKNLGSDWETGTVNYNGKTGFYIREKEK